MSRGGGGAHAVRRRHAARTLAAIAHQRPQQPAQRRDAACGAKAPARAGECAERRTRGRAAQRERGGIGDVLDSAPDGDVAAADEGDQRREERTQRQLGGLMWV